MSAERDRELPPGAVAGDVIRDKATGERFRLVPLPDPSAPTPIGPIDELRGQVERLRGEVRAVQGEARDNARAWENLSKRVEQLAEQLAGCPSAEVVADLAEQVHTLLGR